MNARPRTAFRHRSALGACVALLAVAGLALPAPAQTPPAAAAGDRLDPAVAAGLEVPSPDLSAMRPAARQRVESVRGVLTELLALDEVSRSQVGQAFGFLGQNLHALELPAAAAESYATARRLVPGDVRWSYYQGLLAQSRGDLEAAVGHYRAYAEAAPDEAAVELRLGEALLELGRSDEAQAAYRKALDLDAESAGAAAVAGLGRAALAAGDATAAIDLLERALKLQPRADAVHYPLGQAFQQLEREPLARYHLSLAGDRDPSFPDPLAAVLVGISKSVALQVAGDLAAADDFDEEAFLGFVSGQLGDAASQMIQPLEGLIEQRAEAPAEVRGRLAAALGLLASRAGNDEKSLAGFRQAVELAPELVDTRRRLGNALARSGDFAGALDSYDRVLRVRPADGPTLLQRGTVRANLGQFEEARIDLEAAVAAMPEDGEAQLRLAGVLLRLDRVEDATAAFRRAAETARSRALRAEAHTALAGLTRRGGDLGAALDEYSRALEADPRHGPALAGMASTFGQAGRYRESATLYRRLVEEEPDNRLARMGEVTALVLAGADAAARQRMEAALAHSPDDLAFKDVLARHLAAADDRASRDGGRAVELAEEVYAEASTPESMETLAMAHAQAGNFQQAVEWQERLLAMIAEGSGDSQVAAEPGVLARLRANLERYKRGDVCCADGG